MKRLAGNLLAVAVLAATGLLLLADSARQCPKQTAQTRTFAVSGDCGARGELRVQAAEKSCDLTITVPEETGLPAQYGGVGDDGSPLENGGWTLNGTVTVARRPASGPDSGIAADGGSPDSGPDAGGGLPLVSVHRSCEARRDGGPLVLICRDDGAEAVDCTMTLTAL